MMDYPVFYSIIIVCLNAGDRLVSTVESVLSQKYGGYEIIVKDGGSKDGSVEKLKGLYSDSRLHIYVQGDSGIYDAMNEAVKLAEGDYILFLNAGDSLYDEMVLNKITDGIYDINRDIEKITDSACGENKDAEKKSDGINIENRDVQKKAAVYKTENKKTPDIIYGNMYHKALDTVIYSAPQINDFTCYRNVPCHQTCFYRRAMFEERGYNTSYNVRADYEHFLWCYYEKKADIAYLPVIVAAYEGGGYSETKRNKRLSAAQHREITVKYMGRGKVYKYRLIMLLTLSPIRSAMAQSRYFSGIYNKVKTFIYKLKNLK